ncbi:TonB-dependent receptor domain-containing protein [Kordiimonas laminariae]|uniref:TonB-dependent receptor domain-containing protein n=1 Tax=Kordiimonas laminariae TaxID=2917717 RepID=UPI001FF6DD32|nr:TonB-dependent receptor [Kordiimonas laminariae]MCK0071153.1 TonB-dependent receptor [Kordiimonas laminariae]
MIGSNIHETRKQSKLRLLGSAASLLAVMATGTGIAQAQDADDTDELEVEEVVVTGSLIRRSSYSAPEPIVILGKQDLNDRAFVNVADLLNESPEFGAPAANPAGAQGAFAIGSNVVSLFGLGSNRTLTVVNGRRFVSNNPPVPAGSSLAAGLQVDFNTIPIALVDRIETLLIGGSPTYGSDGIAGVVNVILKDDFEGFEVSGQYGVSDRGDGDSYQIQTTFGGNFAEGRGNLAFSVEYNSQNGLVAADRPFFTQNNPFTSRNGDGETRVFNADRTGRGFVTQALGDFGAISSASNGFLPTIGRGAFIDADGNQNFFEFDENGNAIPFTVGVRPANGGLFFANGGSGSDLFDNVRQIFTPSERINISAIGHYDINDYATFFSEFIFQNAEAREASEQDDILAGIFGADRSSPGFTLDNPFLSNQARGVLSEFLGPDDQFFVDRFLGPVVNGGENFNEAFTWRVVAGLKGEFEFADRNFHWEVSGNFGQSDLETRARTVINERLFNALDAVALTDDDVTEFTANSGLDGQFVIRNGEVIQIATADINTAPRAGDIICNGILADARGELEPDASFPNLVTDARPNLAGCVPLNLFGNQFAPESAAFVSLPSTSSSDTQQRVFQANLGGDLFELPGGTVSFGLTYLNRKEEAVFEPDGIQQIELGQNAPTQPSRGEFKTDEIGAELFIPILKDGDVPFINALNFTPKARYVDHSIAGTDYTYTLAGTLQMFDMITVRGGYTQSIRAPGIQELFDPTLGITGFITDPCDTRFINLGPDGDAANSNRRQNCAAVGIDVEDHTNISSNLSIAGISSGNQNLRNEIGKSYSIGVVVEPEEFIPGLRLSVDYINITIEDQISNITQNQAISACFDSATFPDDICNAHTRDASGQIISFSRSFQNASTSEFEAVQFNTRYDFDVSDALSLFDSSLKDSDLGDFSIRVGGIRRITDILQVVEGNPLINRVGQAGREKWRGNVDFVYNYDKLRVFWRMNYTGRLDLDVQDREALTFFDADDNLITGLNDKFIHNATISYQLTEKVNVSAAINNVFDRKPNITELAYGNFLNAEEFGRSFRFNFRAAF